MIVSSLIDLFITLITSAFSALEFAGLPLDIINTLNDIIVYGTWVVGLDIIALFVTTVVGWWAVKFTVGMIIWLWELLPLT